MGFARMIHKNDRICLSGIVSSEKYETKDGTKVFSVLIDADHIEWTNNKRSSNRKKESESTNPIQQEENNSKSNAADTSIKINLNFAELPFN